RRLRADVAEIAQENSEPPSRSKTVKRALWGLPLMIVLLAFALPLFDSMSTPSDHVAGNVTLDGRPIGHHARAVLDEEIARFAERIEARKLSVALARKRLPLEPKDVGLHVDRARTR